MAGSHTPPPGDPGDGTGAFPDERSTNERILVGLTRLGAVLRSCLWDSAAPQGLNPTQVSILGLLHRGSEAGSSLAHLAAQLGVSPPTVSDSVNSLVAKRLLEKQPSPGDRRTLAITLTAEGRTAAEAADRWPEDLVSAVSTLPAPDQGRLLRSLVTIIRELQQSGQMAPSRNCVTCTYFRPNTGEPDTPHYCAFVEAYFGDGNLRLDCRDHHPAQQERADATWERFQHGPT